MKRFDLFSASNLRPFVPPGICTLTLGAGYRSNWSNWTQWHPGSQWWQINYTRGPVIKVILILYEDSAAKDYLGRTYRRRCIGDDSLSSQICMKSDRYKASKKISFAVVVLPRFWWFLWPTKQSIYQATKWEKDLWKGCLTCFLVGEW